MRCEKDETELTLFAEGLVFERWSCPLCKRRIVVDTEMAQSAVAFRGHPWEWPASAFQK
jgi:hypothetical protein